LSYALEGGHSEPRVAKVADYTGKSIEEHLTKKLSSFKNITILTDLTAIDLLTTSHHSTDYKAKYETDKCVGIYAYDNKDGKVSRIIADQTILASGGYSQIFAFSTNPEGTRGDGVAMAYRAGAKLLGLEFQQFHPTALKIPNAPPFLISEAVRGEGARLTDKEGTPFMQKYFPDLEKPDLTTRDKVSRSIFTEMLNTGTNNVYLDLRSYMSRDHILEHFPMIYETCKKYGIDITKDLIPVSPAAHYSCGGILTDLNGKTSIENLYAIGEVANNGLHGANRLASTSLLEGLVFATRAASVIANHGTPSCGNPESNQINPSSIPSWQDTSEYSADPALIAADKITIKNIMWNMVGLVRKRKIMERAITDLTHLEETINSFYRKATLSDELLGLRNMSQVALLVAKSALANTKSSGCHFREN
jgi:L-aspartate oxidase